MTVYKIFDSEEVFETSYFVVTTWGEIFVDNKELGMFKHPTITTEHELQQHITRMVDDGFEVAVSRI